jgi:hypothetical protein
VSEVEAFDDIRGRVLDDDFFTLARIVETVLGLSRKCRMVQSVHLVENFANHVCGIDSEVEEGFVENDGLNPFVRLELR